MAHDEALAARVAKALGGLTGFEAKRMFGGVAFLVDGKMVCGVATADLMVRVGAERGAAVLKEPGVRPMDFTGRPLKGYVYVSPRVLKTPAALKRWLRLALENRVDLDLAERAKRKRATRASAPRPSGSRRRARRSRGGRPS